MNINAGRAKVIDIGWTDRFGNFKHPVANFGADVGTSMILDEETNRFVLWIGILDGTLIIIDLWIIINVRE
jgi:hypothetical protein